MVLHYFAEQTFAEKNVSWEFRTKFWKYKIPDSLMFDFMKIMDSGLKWVHIAWSGFIVRLQEAIWLNPHPDSQNACKRQRWSRFWTLVRVVVPKLGAVLEPAARRAELTDGSNGSRFRVQPLYKSSSLGELGWNCINLCRIVVKQFSFIASVLQNGPNFA